MKMRVLFVWLLASVALASGCARQAAPAATAKPQSLTVLYGESTSDPGLEDIFTEHLSRAAADVVLDWESVDWGERFSSLLRMKIAAGEVPDLIIGKAQDVRAFQPTGILAALEPELSAHVQELGLEQVTIDGQVYGLPYNMLYQGVLYNKNIFYRYGLSVPDTLQELHDAVVELERVGITPFGTHFQEVWYTGNVLMQFAANEVFSVDPDWGDRFRQERASYGGDLGWAHCYDQLAYVYEHSWPDALSIAQHEADRRFANEECAMYLTGSWSIQTLLTTAPQRKLGIFPYPNSAGDAKLLFEPNITFMCGSQSPQKALVERLLAALLMDQELGQRVFQFTQTDSLLVDIESDTLQIIRESIDEHKSQDRMLDVTVGNRQLVWQYQYDCAEAALSWLKGESTREAALHYADQHRLESGTSTQ